MLQEPKTLIGELESFRGELNQNQEFVHFKTIFGYKSAFLQSWESDGRTWDIMQRPNYREKEIAEYLLQINTANYKYWKSLIVECINSEPRPEAGDHFCNFLYNLSKIHPDFVLEILKENEEKLSHVGWMILLPIYESDQKDKAESVIIGWIDNQKYLEQIILIFTRCKELNKELIKNVFSAAASINNHNAIIVGLRDLSISGPDKKSSAIELLKIALPILTEAKNSEWTAGFSFNYQFFDDLEENLADQVLENLLTATRITDAMQYILKTIADKYPVKVMEFFGKRIASKQEFKKGAYYHSIPSHFFIISESLTKNPELVIKCVKSWYKPDDTGVFSFTGGKLVHLLFAEFNKELEGALLNIIESKDITDIKFVNLILGNYEGKNCVHNICKEIVKLLPENSPELQGVKTSLNGNMYSGWGEHAISDNKRSRLEEIRRWENDDNIKVKNFAKDYMVNLESEMKTYRRHEDGIIESLKSQHDDIE